MKAQIPKTTDGLTCDSEEVWIPIGKGNDDSYRYYYIRQNAIDMLEWLFEKKIINLKEKENLTSMIDSPDDENLYLAVEIIKVKKDGINIQTGNAYLSNYR